MTLGKVTRLRRLLGQSGKLLGITLDHPISRGVLPGIEDVKSTLDDVARAGPDSVTLHKGIASRLFEPHAGGALSLILKATAYSPYHNTYDSPTAEVDEALRLGADAISVGVLVGSERQDEQTAFLAKISREAELAGLPLVAHIYPRGPLLEGDRLSIANVAYAVRLGAELGVDLIKTEWTGSSESFAQVVEAGSPAMVALAGGQPGNDLRSYFEMTKDMLDVGGAGVTYGRFVWGHKHPAAVINGLKALIHDNSTIEEALEAVDEDRTP